MFLSETYTLRITNGSTRITWQATTSEKVRDRLISEARISIAMPSVKCGITSGDSSTASSVRLPANSNRSMTKAAMVPTASAMQEAHAVMISPFTIPLRKSS